MRRAMVQAIGDAAQASGGRPVPAANLHVTLAFLSSVPLRRQPELAAAARESALEPAAIPLELRFDRLELWRQAQVLCAAPAAPPAWTVAVAGQLQARLVAGGFAPDLKPFRPHVTVARKVARANALGAMPAVLWRFTELALIESRTLPAGPLYSVVESYSLCRRRKGRK